MKVFLNEEKKPFKDLSNEEMLAIIKAKINGGAEFYNGDNWHNSDISNIDLRGIYRTKQKQLDIPWHILLDDIKWVAMDESGDVYGYAKKPERDNIVWGDLTGTTYPLFNMKFEKTGIDWKTSLVMRPKGV